jgi:hypothetical protein
LEHRYATDTRVWLRPYVESLTISAITHDREIAARAIAQHVVEDYRESLN